MKLKEDVPGRVYFEKNWKNANPCAIPVQLQIGVPKQTYIFSLDTSSLWYSIKCQTRGVPEVICAQRHTTTCMSRHNSRWLLTLTPTPCSLWLLLTLTHTPPPTPPPPPPKDPINARALSLGPRLSLFSEVGYINVKFLIPERIRQRFNCLHNLFAIKIFLYHEFFI